MSLARACHLWWCCRPLWFRVSGLTLLMLVEFPLVHSFWNAVGFEGFFQ